MLFLPPFAKGCIWSGTSFKPAAISTSSLRKQQIHLKPHSALSSNHSLGVQEPPFPNFRALRLWCAAKFVSGCFLRDLRLCSVFLSGLALAHAL